MALWMDARTAGSAARVRSAAQTRTWMPYFECSSVAQSFRRERVRETMTRLRPAADHGAGEEFGVVWRWCEDTEAGLCARRENEKSSPFLANSAQ